MASPPYAASMKVLSHSERQPLRGTGRTKDVPGFDPLTGSLAFISNLSMRAGSAREPVTRELSGPNRHESLVVGRGSSLAQTVQLPCSPRTK